MRDTRDIDHVLRSPKLLDQLRTAIRLRHFSSRTEEAYVGWARRFILFHGKRHPKDMGEPEVAAFLTYLAQKRLVSASTQNQALASVLFLYRHVLGRELGELPGLVWAKRSVHVPVVLTREEVVGVLGQMSGASWLIAMPATCAYGGCLAVSAAPNRRST